MTHSFESGLERDFFSILEMDINVQYFEEQPVTISFQDKKGVQRRYTPDVLVVFRTDIDCSPKETWLCEVKYREDIFSNWKEYKPKFKAAIKYAKKKGWKFKLVSEVEIKTSHLENVRFLKHYRGLKLTGKEEHLLLSTLNSLELTSPCALMSKCCDDKWERAKLVPYLWKLVGDRRIGCDLNRSLSMQSEIWTLEHFE